MKDQFVTENETSRRLAEILTKIAKLPSANLEPPGFFANFLQLSAAATGSVGGAIWVIQPEQPPQCYCHVELEKCLINEPTQQKVIVEAVLRACKEEKPLVLPASGTEMSENDSAYSNQCPYPLFFKPIKAANQVAMVLQLIGSQNLTAHDFRAVVNLLDQVCESAETYLAHRRAEVLDDDRKSLARILKYTEGIHSSLELDRVIYQMANLGRDTIGCERVVIWINPKVKRGLRAVSGIDKPDRRAVLMQSIEKLCRHCLEIKKPIVAAREQIPELPEDDPLTELVKNYFNVSKLNQIYLQPIKSEDTYLGVLVAEGFDEQKGVNLTGVIASVASHGAIALNNALEIAAIPVLKPLSKIKKIKADPKRKQKWMLFIAACVIGLILLCFVPWMLRIECGCELTPKQMRTVESALDKVKIMEIVKPSGQVKKGEVIARLDDMDLQTELYSLQQSLHQQMIKRDAAMDSERGYIECEIASLRNKIKFTQYEIDMCTVRAPIDGTILTAQLELKVGTVLNKGDVICEIGDLRHWQLRLDVPQEEIDWVRKGLARNQVDRVKFFLKSYPQYKLEAEISNINQIAQKAFVDTTNGNVFHIRVDVAPEQLSKLGKGLRRTGMIGRAKIATLERPLGYVLLRKVIRFFRVTFF